MCVQLILGSSHTRLPTVEQIKTFTFLPISTSCLSDKINPIWNSTHKWYFSSFNWSGFTIIVVFSYIMCLVKFWFMYLRFYPSLSAIFVKNCAIFVKNCAIFVKNCAIFVANTHVQMSNKPQLPSAQPTSCVIYFT